MPPFLATPRRLRTRHPHRRVDRPRWVPTARAIDQRIRTFMRGKTAGGLNISRNTSSYFGDMRPVQTGPNTYYLIMVREDDSGNDRLFFQKTTNHGQSFSASTEFSSLAIDLDSVWSIYYDQWTNGDSGTLIHVVVQPQSGTLNILYYTLDTSDDSLVGPTTIDTVADVAGNVNVQTTQIQMGKTRGGLLKVHWNNLQTATHTSQLLSKSGDGHSGAWTEQTSFWEDAVGDQYLFSPGDETDTDDFWMFHLDVTANEITRYTYDDSAGTWSESAAIATGITVEWDVVAYAHQWSVTSDHNDNTSILVYWTEIYSGTADLKAVRVGTAGNTALTSSGGENVLDNTDQSYSCAVSIDQNNQLITVFYLLAEQDGGTGYHLDPSGPVANTQYKTYNGTDWSPEHQANNSLSNNFRYVFTCPSTSNWGRPRALMGTSVNEALFCDGDIIDTVGAAGVYAIGTIPIVEDISYRHGTANSGATHFVERPRGCLVDDLLIIFLNVGKANQNFTAPTGWTLIYEQTGNIAQDEVGMWCGYKYVVAREPNDYKITSSGSPESSVIMRISNPRRNTLNPFSQAIIGKAGGQADETSPEINIALKNSLVVRGAFANDEGWEGLTTSGVHESLFGLSLLGSLGADFLNATFPQLLIQESGFPAGTEGVGFSFAIPNSDAVGAVGNLIPKALGAGII